MPRNSLGATEEELRDNIQHIHSHRSNHKAADQTMKRPTYFLVAILGTPKTRELPLKDTNFHRRTPMLHPETKCLCDG